MTKPIKLGEFLHRVKVPVKIDPNKDYSLVTVKLYHKGVILREKKKGALLGSNMYRVSAGHFILSGIDARNGAFGIVPPELDGAIVTNDFWYFDVDETKVKRDFFFWLTNTPLFADACIKSSKGETQRIRLQKDLFYDFEFHFPPIEQQEAFLQRIQRSDSILKSLGDEVAEQSTHLTQLRQAILQEAIEGKLTAAWREKNPSGLPQASHLPLAGEEQDVSQGSPPAKGEWPSGRGGSYPLSQDQIMERLNNLPLLRYFRKELRKKLTPAEAKLWTMLQGKQIAGKKFRRQHSFERYIMDFYCASDHLAIELDGEVHNSVQAQEYDAERTLWLEQFGIRVLRFENKEVFDNPEYVLGTIRAALEEGGNPTTPAFGHPSFAGGEQDVSQSSPQLTGITSKAVSQSSPPAKGEYGEAGRGLEYYDAAVLLEKIKAEKAKLIAAGKLKKEKPLPPIEPGEVLFALPEGWVWTRLGNLGFTQTGTTPSTTDKRNFGNYIPFIKPADIFTDKILYETDGLSEKGLKSGRLIGKDSILMVCIGGSIGKAFIVDRAVSCNQQINTITPSSQMLPRFLLTMLHSPYFYREVWDKAMKSSTPIINKGKWESIPVVLPPLAEQHAIVERVDKLLAMVDQLEKQVAERREQAEQLMQAVLREAFG